jgi:hypothetical protein
MRLTLSMPPFPGVQPYNAITTIPQNRISNFQILTAEEFHLLLEAVILEDCYTY